MKGSADLLTTIVSGKRFKFNSDRLSVVVNRRYILYVYPNHNFLIRKKIAVASLSVCDCLGVRYIGPIRYDDFSRPVFICFKASSALDT